MNKILNWMEAINRNTDLKTQAKQKACGSSMTG